MKGLLKWWRAEPTRVEREPVLLENVESAKLSDQDLEQRTKEAQTEFIQGLLKLGRRSAELRFELGRATLRGRSGH